ncbi:ANK REP REGION domain-containing protein [Citrus sinensis]|uniref:ANK REP REGION domain-containing protein n=2 Tax=Citrus sinensis TaxID=2711 RepID=A0ACB8I7F1_CITSI|nr:ANK REP REGION domain-containing protein [Citrus sinensis]
MSTIFGKIMDFLTGSGQQSSRGARVLLNEELIRQRLEQRNVELESQQSTGGSASHQGEENPPAVLPSSTSEENPPAVLPSSTVLSVRRELQKSARDGDWAAFETKFQQNPDLIRAAITNRGDTILHLAVVEKHPDFIEQVVNRMEVEDLALRDKQGNTAFLIAVITGNREAAVKMLSKNGGLLSVLEDDQATPLCKALYFEQMEIASYLYDEHKASFTEAQLFDAFVTSIKVGKYDFALALITNLHDIPDKDKIWKPLQTLAGRPKDFLVTPGVYERICNYVLRREGQVNPALRIVKDLWGRLNSTDLSEGGKDSFVAKASEMLFIAAKSGNMEFLTTIVNDLPELVNSLNCEGQTLFHVAVLHGQRSVLRLLYGGGARTEELLDTKDEQGENILHCAARYTNTGIDALSWPVVQLQEELLNFMEIERFVIPKLRNERIKGSTEHGESGNEHRRIGGTKVGATRGIESGSSVETKLGEIKGTEPGSSLETKLGAIKGTAKCELGATPLELFLHRHADLVKGASKWITTIAGACLVVTTLNATIVFTGSPSEIPGEHNGVPLSSGVEKVLVKLFGVAHGFAILTSREFGQDKQKKKNVAKKAVAKSKI